MTAKVHFVLFILCILVIVNIPCAAIPQHIAYQGALTDTSGNPRPDNTYSFTFSLYDTETGGTALWSETKSLYVKNGMFSTFLGNTTPFGSAVTFDKPYWLGISVNGATEQSPRIVLASNAYCFRALYSDTAEYAKRATSGNADSAGVSANSYKWNNNTWGAVYPKATLADTAEYAKVTTSGIVDSAAVSDNSWMWNNYSWGTIYPTSTSAIRAGNADSLNGQYGSFYQNATNVTTGTLNDARLSANVSKLGATIESAEITDRTIQRDDVVANFKAPYADTADYATVARKVVSSGSGVSSDTVVTAAVKAKDKNGLNLVNDSGDGIFVDSSGNVGIGTVSPERKFQLLSANYAQQSIKTSNIGLAELLLGDSISVLHGAFSWDGPNNILNLFSPSLKNLAFQKDGGNVGIGTTNPSMKLEIQGNPYDAPIAGEYNKGLLSLGTSGVPYWAFRLSNTDDGAPNFNIDANFGTGYTPRFTIMRGSGNVGIGTTNPIAKLEVIGYSRVKGYSDIQLDPALSAIAFILGSDDLTKGGIQFQGLDAKTVPTGSTRLISIYGGFTTLALGDENDIVSIGNGSIFVDPGNGNVGIGTTNPTAKLHVVGSEICVSTPENSPLGEGGQIGFNGQGEYPRFYIDNFYGNMRIVGQSSTWVTINNGNVGIGITNPSYRLQVGDTSNYGYVDASGAWQTGSDKRFKENVKQIDSGLNKIKAMRGVEYNAIGDDPVKHKTIGFIAQEIEKIVPEVVSTDLKGYKGIAYAKITPLLVEAIKEQQKIIEQQKEKIKQQEENYSQLNTDIQKIKRLLKL